MQKIISRFFLIVLCVVFVFMTLFPVISLAQGPGGPGGGPPGGGGGPPGAGGGPVGGTPVSLPNPLCPSGSPDCSSFLGILNNILGWLVVIASPIAVIMVLIGAYQILFSGGSPDEISRAKKTLIFTVVGYVLVLMSVGLVKLIYTILKEA